MIPIYQLKIDEDINGEAEVEFVSLVDMPAIEKNFQAFNKERVLLQVQNEEKRIVAGAAMLADTPIYRADESGEYYVVFSKDTIQQIVQKFFKKGYGKKFNVMHNASEVTNDVTIFQSFISDKELGILPMQGYEDAPDGSWFIVAKVDDDNVWERIKSGELRGFSIEGVFKKERQKMTKEEAYQKIQDILNGTDFTN